MKQICRQNETGWMIPRDQLVPLEDGFGGAAARRLAAFEQMARAALEQQEQLTRKLEQLRGENKTKTVQFRELMGKKLMNTQVISMLQAYGLLEE